MASKKGMSFSIASDEIMYTSISKSKSGYNSASIGVKKGDNEYLSISYEWQGDDVTDIAMDVMSFMSANKEEIAAAKEAHAEELAAKKGVNPFVKKDEEEDPEMDPKMKDKKKEKMKKKEKCSTCEGDCSCK